jgi:hypothetical protein
MSALPSRSGRRTKRPELMEQEPSPGNRRSNHELREVLDDLICHVREIARMRSEMPPHEIEYAQQRLEWLADEAWRLAVGRERDS